MRRYLVQASYASESISNMVKTPKTGLRLYAA